MATGVDVILAPSDRAPTAISRITTETINRVLRGAKPADLPIQQPTRFDLLVNQKIARAMGLTVPRSVPLSATEVIQ